MAKRAIYFSIFLFLLFSFVLYAENHIRLVNWKSHTSMWNINDGIIDEDKNFWAATGGGLFKYNLKDSSFTLFSNINELISLELTAIASNDANGDIYIGTADGILEILKDGNQWIHILDIKRAGFTNPRINDIAFFENKAFIACAFGLTVFDTEKKVFIEDALNIGNFPPNVPINKILIHQNNIWLATDVGIARADLSQPLAPRDAWINYSYSQGLYATVVKDLIIYRNSLYASTDKGIFRLIGDNFELVSNIDVINFSTDNNELYFSTEFFLKSLTRDSYFGSYPHRMTGHISYFDAKDSIIIAFYQNYGFAIYNGKSVKIVLPPTPSSNSIKSLKVDDKGKLWACSDGTTFGTGFMVLANDAWQNFTPFDFGDIGSKLRSAYLINVHPKGDIILSTKGSGLILAKKVGNSFELSVFDESNAPFIGNGFTVVGQTAIDNKGTIWMPQFGAMSSGPNLLSLDLDGNFKAFVNRIVPNQRSFIHLVIDNWNTKWLASDNGYSGGIYYFNENNTPNDLSDDKAGMLTTSNSSLLDNNCTALALDANGMIWVGTPNGISVIINPSAALTNSQIVIRKEIRDLRNIFINDIMVDALNNKWVATSNGVFVLDPEGITLDIITSSNSPLLSNDVQCLATDIKSGKIYFGTRFGISEAQSLSVLPQTEYSLNCYPQPFNPIIDGEMVIEGLEADSDIRIVTINGEHVRTIKVMGNVAVWDGRDSSGRLVENGVYLILTTSAKTGNSAFTKIAVINGK